MSQHTPGPWEQVANSIYSRMANCVVVRLPGQTNRVGDEPPEQIERWDADACLIAAAPELLEALENLLKVLGDLEGGIGLQYNEADIARAAIAKAKGEEHE